jgi:hypothetical protein
MPKWLSSLLIVVGLLALIGLAFMPRNIEVTVITNVNDSDTTIVGGDYDNSHTAPAPEMSGE